MLGARPLRRTIQREIEDPLSEKILFGELSPGQIVVIDTAPVDPMKKDGPETFTFRGEPKPSALVPDDPGRRRVRRLTRSLTPQLDPTGPPAARGRPCRLSATAARRPTIVPATSRVRTAIWPGQVATPARGGDQVGRA